METPATHGVAGAQAVARDRGSTAAKAGDDAGGFELAHTFGDGGLAQVHAPAEFGHRQAGIGLQLSEDPGVVGVEFDVQGEPR